jgi:hypothetical protein
MFSTAADVTMEEGQDAICSIIVLPLQISHQLPVPASFCYTINPYSLDYFTYI